MGVCIIIRTPTNAIEMRIMAADSLHHCRPRPCCLNWSGITFLFYVITTLLSLKLRSVDIVGVEAACCCHRQHRHLFLLLSCDDRREEEQESEEEDTVKNEE